MRIRYFINFFCLLIILFINISIIYGQENRLTLEQSIKIAYQNNQDIIIAKEQLKTSEAQKQQAIATALPSLTLANSYTNYFSNINGNEDPQRLYKTEFSLDQILWSAHVIPAISAADLLLQKSKYDFQRKKQDIELSVTKAFFGVLKAKRFLGIVLQSIDLAKEHLRQVMLMEEIGMATETDVLQTKLTLSKLNRDLINVKSSLKLAEDAFNYAIGLPLDTPVKIDSNYTIAMTPGSLDQVLADAQENRYDIKAMQKTIKMLEANIHVVGTSQWPSLGINATYDWSNSDNFSYEESDQNWQWTLGFSWTFFDGLATLGKIKEAESTLEQTESQYSQLIDGILIEVRESWQKIQTAVQTLEITTTELDLAKKNLEANQLKYRYGAGSNLDLLDAQTKILSTRNSMANSEYDYEIAKAELCHAIGVNIVNE